MAPTTKFPHIDVEVEVRGVGGVQIRDSVLYEFVPAGGPKIGGPTKQKWGNWAKIPLRVFETSYVVPSEPEM